ncbi:uncharacterized protein LOC17885963 [Capsella rubella]|nr:uncharacterized protein LOC17885963 [Capsella rubella]
MSEKGMLGRREDGYKGWNEGELCFCGVEEEREASLVVCGLAPYQYFFPNPSAKETEMKRIKKDETEDKQVNKKENIEWRREICAYSVGKCIKVTGGGENRKCYYETFQFRGTQYSLEDTVLLAPYESKKTNYIALIKDIYVKKKDGFVKILVQWFYRRKDIKIKHAGKCKSGDSEEIFFSFHKDELFAESVRSKCLVYFLPDDKQTSNRTQPPDFIVQKVYDNINNKLRELSDKGFNVHQKFEISTLVAKTISRIEIV